MNHVSRTHEKETEKYSSSVTVSFIIPALNEEKLIGSCLESIKKLNLPGMVSTFEIIVVDNQSTDDTAEISTAHGAKVVACPRGNVSLARNMGARLAKGDWLAFVDADCCLDADWLVHCAANLAGKETVATGCQILPPAETKGWVTRTLGSLSQIDASSEPTATRWLPTAGLLLEKEHFDSIGGFNEQLVTCEDSDLGYRLSERGQLVFVPAATLVHHGESTSIGEILRREAWRTRGNFKLAMSRPRDLQNWLSFFVPVVFVMTLIVGTGLAMTLFLFKTSVLYPMGLWLLGTMIPAALVVRKLRTRLSASNFFQQWTVMAAFLFGRAIGLVWGFPRVER